jgi:formylglycine-generating enzyme required for sulfatase activity
MAMVYTSAGKLPEDRADLYRRCVDLLLDTWQRRIEERDATGELVIDGGILEKLNISEENLRNALYRVAYQAHARQGAPEQRTRRTADITKDELRSAFALADEEFDQVLRYIQNRAGLIYWRGGEMYSFPHRSFQEYLAANHLGTLPKKQTRDLIRQDAEWWREVFLLQVGQRREQLEDARALIEYVCSTEYESGAKYEPADWQSAVLAGQALVELRMRERIAEKKRHQDDTTPYEDLVKQVLKWLVALTDTPVLTSRERAQAGLVLGALGDPRNFYELCRVPAGEFVMGERNEAHNITLNEFWIAKYPVTCAQYQKFIDAGGYQKPEYWKSKAAREWLSRSRQGAPKYWDDPRWNNKSNLPVVGVTWFEAQAYCEWLNEQFSIFDVRFSIDDQVDRDLKSAITNRKLKIRLPTEAEWEKAATWDYNHKQKRIYPWVGEFDPAKANTAEGQDPVGSTSSVGIYPTGASPCGALDMAGNVWEWCSTLYQEYPYRLDTKHESLEAEGSRVLRGGSWSSKDNGARGAFRDDYSPDLWVNFIGFRVVVSSSSF